MATRSPNAARKAAACRRQRDLRHEDEHAGPFAPHQRRGANTPRSCRFGHAVENRRGESRGACEHGQASAASCSSVSVMISRRTVTAAEAWPEGSRSMRRRKEISPRSASLFNAAPLPPRCVKAAASRPSGLAPASSTLRADDRPAGRIACGPRRSGCTALDAPQHVLSLGRQVCDTNRAER